MINRKSRSVPEQVTKHDFKEWLLDTLTVVQRLSPHCSSLEELESLLLAAVGDDQVPGNPAQVSILMQVMGKPPAQTPTVPVRRSL